MEYTITIKVKSEFDDDILDVCHVVQKLIDVGQYDAQETNDNPDLCDDESDLASRLVVKVDIGKSLE